MFFTPAITNLTILVSYILSSANAFEFDSSKILLFGKGYSGFAFHVAYFSETKNYLYYG